MKPQDEKQTETAIFLIAEEIFLFLFCKLERSTTSVFSEIYKSGWGLKIFSNVDPVAITRAELVVRPFRISGSGT
jgi:hypothetical protein